MTKPALQGGNGPAGAWHTVGPHVLHGHTSLKPLPGPKMGGAALGYRAGSSGAQGRETPRAQHSLGRAPVGVQACTCPRSHVQV